MRHFPELATSPALHNPPRRQLPPFPVPLLPADFRRFLAAKPADEPVGMCMDPWRCPIHEWLKTFVPTLRITVVPRVYLATRDFGQRECRYACPAWISEFGFRLDQRHRAAVTAADCLAVLDAIEVLA